MLSVRKSAATAETSLLDMFDKETRGMRKMADRVRYPEVVDRLFYNLNIYKHGVSLHRELQGGAFKSADPDRVEAMPSKGGKPLSTFHVWQVKRVQLCVRVRTHAVFRRTIDRVSQRNIKDETILLRMTESPLGTHGHSRPKA